ncbi:MAG TPA: hypothetical protein VF054_07735 [Micromonosporaceae bacterium]
MRTPSPAGDLETKLERWVSSGIITAEQAALIRADEARGDGASAGDPRATPAQPSPEAHRATSDPPGGGTAAPTRPVDSGDQGRRRTSLVAEAMGYLGGVVILVASGLVTSRIWGQLPVGARIALPAAVAALLLVAGALVPPSLGAPGRRLRAVLWLASSIALFTCLAITGTQGFGWRDPSVELLAGAGTAVYSAALWWAHRQVPQNLATFAALLVTIAALTTMLPHSRTLPEVSMWAAGVVWAVLSWGSLVTPRRAGLILGSVAAVVNVFVLMSETWGMALALATVAGLIVAAVAFRDLALLGVASVGTLFVLPRAMARFFPGVLSAAFALLLVGVVLVATAIVTARRRREEPVAGRRDWSVGTPGTATVIAGTVATVTAVAVVLAGL